MRRAIAIAVAALAACKGRSTSEPAAGSATASVASGAGSGASASAPAGSGAADPAAWPARCAAALAAAPRATPVRRIQTILDGCQPCGDWTPLLRWQTPSAEGGPTGDSIVAAMEACRAYCNTEAKTGFLGALEGSRGKRAPKPWRLLGDACGAAVSAVPDGRYQSAPFFALDRIARAAAAEPALAPLLAAIELPLPPLAETAAAVVLPSSPVMHPEPGAVQLTVSATGFTLGPLPRARLGAEGVTVIAGEAAERYPGAPITAAALAAALDKLLPDPSHKLAVIAPKELPARRLVDVAAAAGTHAIALAVEATGAPEGWKLPGIIPLALRAKRAPGAVVIAVDHTPDDSIRELKALAPAQLSAAPPVIELTERTTVSTVAKVLGALVYRGVSSAAIELRRPPP